MARYGGEEFTVILTQADQASAMTIAERIRAQVEETPFPGEESQPGGNLTVSLGVATFPDHAKTPVDLIEFSDQALYHSKNNGRNLVTLYSDITPVRN